MKILILGDIHGKWKRANLVIKHENPDLTLCTGDFCNYDFSGDKMVFVYGNHESAGFLEQARQNEKLKPLFPGNVYKQNGVRIAGLSGVYSQRFFEQKERPLKYYGREDVETTASLKDIDILLTHEAPAGVGLEKNGADIGKPEIREVIERVRPKIAVFGHHHKYHEAEIGDTKVIGLDYPHRSYLVLDSNNFSFKKIDATIKHGRYRFDWE